MHRQASYTDYLWLTMIFLLRLGLVGDKMIYTVETPKLSAISIDINQVELDILDQLTTVFRAKANVMGIKFQTISDTENNAYVGILQAIDDFSFSGYFASQ